MASSEIWLTDQGRYLSINVGTTNIIQDENSTINNLTSYWYGFLNVECITNLKLIIMLRWTVIFLVVAVIAAIFGFGGISESAAGIAKVLFFIFIVLFIISLITGRKSV